MARCEGGVLGCRGARGLRHIGDEAGRADPAAAQLRQIDLARAVLERIGTGRPGYVDMRVQGDDGTMDGERVRLHGVVHANTLTDNRPLGKRVRRVSIAIAVSIAAGCGSASAVEGTGSASGSVGSWVLDCPDNGCTLRHVHPLFARAGVTAQLEVRTTGAGRVPVVTVRGLPRDPMLSAAVGEGIRATLQLGNQAPALLACGLAGEVYLCQPTGTAAAALSRALPDAGSVTIALAAALPGQSVQPIGKRTLDLAGTREALWPICRPGHARRASRRIRTGRSQSRAAGWRCWTRG